MEEEIFPLSRVPKGVLEHIFTFLDPVDRNAVSEVCVEWKELDSSTRRSVRVINCFSVAPSTLCKRFPKLEALAIDGHHEYSWMWDCKLEPWVREITAKKQQLKSFSATGMFVTGADLTSLADCFSESLTSLRLQNCLGYDTVGLASITKRCRLLEVFDLDCYWVYDDAQNQNRVWLRHMAEPNSKLRELNIKPCGDQAENVKLIVENCSALRSLKLNIFTHFREISAVVNRSYSLVELGPGTLEDLDIPSDPPWRASFPPCVTSLCDLDLDDGCLPVNHTTLFNLKRLEIYDKEEVSPANYYEVLSHCSNVEVLKIPDRVGDDGLIVVASTCMNLKEISVLCQAGFDANRTISPRGILPVIQTCGKLEHIEICVSKLNSATLAAIGSHCHALKECRIRTFQHSSVLDDGVKLLLQGCKLLTVLSMDLESGALTGRGLAYIGTYGEALRSIELRGLDETNRGDLDSGIYDLATGCKYLEKLILRRCHVSETGLADAVCQTGSLKYIFAEGGVTADHQGRVLAQCRQNWVVEFTSSPFNVHSTMILAYSSLAEPRSVHDGRIEVLTSRVEH